jgi:hypothetical protein
MSGIVAESVAFGSRLRPEFHSRITLKKKIGIFWSENTSGWRKISTKCSWKAGNARSAEIVSVTAAVRCA